MNPPITDEERDWAAMVAAEIAQEMLEEASRLLFATWPEGSDMYAIARRLAQQAIAIYADIRHQKTFHAMPDLENERVWQSRRVSTLQPTVLMPDWKPRVTGGDGRPGSAPVIHLETVDGGNTYEVVDEDPPAASTAELVKFKLDVPEIEGPPVAWRKRRRERRLALRKAEVQ